MGLLKKQRVAGKVGSEFRQPQQAMAGWNATVRFHPPRRRRSLVMMGFAYYRVGEICATNRSTHPTPDWMGDEGRKT